MASRAADDGGNAGAGFKDGLPFRPWAAELAKKRAAEIGLNDPDGLCLPQGPLQYHIDPQPLKIAQMPRQILIVYESNYGLRTIYMDGRSLPAQGTVQPNWHGYSIGRWDGDTLVVDVTNFNDRTWFDRAGDFHSDALHLVERYTMMTPDIIWYEVSIEDPNVFTRPWKIAMPLYRRVEPNMQLLEFRCNEFVEEFMYGNLRKTPLVKHWEGDTMTIDITRKVPPGDLFYQWYGR